MTKKLSIVKHGSKLTLSKTKSLMTITNKILLNKETPPNQIVDSIYDSRYFQYLNELSEILDIENSEQKLMHEEKALVDDSWINRLLEWAENNIIQENSFFPKNKKELKSIKQINLRWNRLEKLPKELFCLEQINILNLANNKIIELPIEIGKLKNLEELNLNINNLQFLPKDIVQLKKLKKINIKNNKNLEITDEQIAWLKSLIDNECLVKYDKYKYNLGE